MLHRTQTFPPLKKVIDINHKAGRHLAPAFLNADEERRKTALFAINDILQGQRLPVILGTSHEKGMFQNESDGKTCELSGTQRTG